MPGRFLQLAEELLKTLRQDFPQFIFSNKINFTEDEVRLQNDGAFPTLGRTQPFR